MSRIDDLIARQCPKGVEWLPLGQAGTLRRGRRFTKADLVPDGISSIHYGEIYTHYGVSTEQARSFVRAELADSLRYAEPGEVVIAGVGETVEDVGKAVAWLGDSKVAFHDDCFAFKHDLDPKFVSYALQAPGFHRQKDRYVSRGKLKRLSVEGLGMIRIPVPPIEVQREVVSILDMFAELEAEMEMELEAELAARRAQYTYYRDSLLTFTERERVRWVTVADLGVLFGGLVGKSKADFTNGNTRYVSYRNVFEHLAVDVHASDFVRVGPGERQRALVKGDILFTGSSENREECGMTSVVTREPEGPLLMNSFCIGLRPNNQNDLNPEFAKHLFRSRALRDQISRTANGVTRYNVSKQRLAQVRVPIPDQNEQGRLAHTLDSLDAVIKGLSRSLPAERRVRRQQYEYHHARLLTFPEAL